MSKNIISKNTKEWEHREHNIYLPNFAFKELSVDRCACAHKIIFKDDEYNLVKTEDIPSVKFERDDWTVYGWLLQYTAYKNYSILSHYSIGEALKFACRENEKYKDCNKASRAVKRLSQAGYLLDIRSTVEGRIYPLVRMENGNPISPTEGFNYWVEEAYQMKAFNRQRKAEVKQKARDGMKV